MPSRRPISGTAAMNRMWQAQRTTQTGRRARSASASASVAAAAMAPGSLLAMQRPRQATTEAWHTWGWSDATHAGWRHASHDADSSVAGGSGMYTSRSSPSAGPSAADIWASGPRHASLCSCSCSAGYLLRAAAEAAHGLACGTCPARLSLNPNSGSSSSRPAGWTIESARALLGVGDSSVAGMSLLQRNLFSAAPVQLQRFGDHKIRLGGDIPPNERPATAAGQGHTRHRRTVCGGRAHFAAAALAATWHPPVHPKQRACASPRRPAVQAHRAQWPQLPARRHCRHGCAPGHLRLPLPGGSAGQLAHQPHRHPGPRALDPAAHVRRLQRECVVPAGRARGGS